MVSKKYQLVIQFPLSADDENRFDAITEFEDRLDTWVAPEAEVDGNDVGASEMNIFVHTDSPDATLKRIQVLLARDPILANYRAGYRAFGADHYVAAWPPGLETFAVA